MSTFDMCGQKSQGCGCRVYVSSVNDIIRLECAKRPTVGHGHASSMICEISEAHAGEIPM